jgi:hypothetical protein
MSCIQEESADMSSQQWSDLKMQTEEFVTIKLFSLSAAETWL